MVCHAFPALAALTTGLILLAPGVGRADALANYQIKVITQLGQKAQDFVPSGYLAVDALNDADQVVFGTFLPGNQIGLVQYSGGGFTTIAEAKGSAPNGKTWPASLDFYVPTSINKAGDLALVAAYSSGPLGVYLWDNAKKSLLPVAEKGTLLANGLTFETGANAVAGAAINNRDEIAFIGTAKTASNQKHFGVFLRHPDGQIQAVALPGDPLPGNGGTVQDAGIGTINDDGQITVGATSSQTGALGSYLWESGNLTLIAERDTNIPGFGVIGSAAVVGVSNANHNVLITASLRQGGKTGLFFWNAGQFTPVVAVGDDLPGGGKLKSTFWAGLPSEAGQYPLLASINDSGTTCMAAYVIGADGKLTPVVKNGMTTDLGTITSIGGHGANIMVVNSQGEVGLVLQFDKGPDTLVLLSPKTP